ncbi:MAG TPA: FAD-dependent oxidoreductase [Chitinophagales bacterium]
MLIVYALFVTVLIKTSGDKSFKKVLPNKTVNDVTKLNPIQVGQIVKPHTVEEIVAAIKSTNGSISIGGGRFSMGGQIGYENSLHFDMREFNRVIMLDTVQKQITVQSGITWRELQKFIDPHNLSVKIMQTYANFTVGGSVSVNCHGRYVGHGPIISSVLALKIVTASGDTVTANRTENTEIFNAAIGGYGGIGVISEVTLQLADNVKVERQTKFLKTDKYNAFFNENIRDNKNVIFQNGDLYPPNYDRVNSVAWSVTNKALTDTERVNAEGKNYWLEHLLIEIASWGNWGKRLREKIIDPIIYRKEAVLWRNREASYDVQELEPKSREKYTYVLQEYFIPVNNIHSFIPKMRAVFDKYNVNVMNVSLRHALPDTTSLLSWAQEEVFAFVVYYKQGTDTKSRETVKQWTLEMTDAILSENGTWYLPYIPNATVAQFKKGYPKSDEYFALKNKLDSTQRFTNKLLDKYNPYSQNRIDKADINGYFRPEEQTVLTVPEWYLVFNPKEYADFLQSGKNPSDFPYYASIKEYWSLYDRSVKLASEAYPENNEYKTMLQVIGVSVTMEYAAKMIYENTVGRFFGWFANGTISDKEKTIATAQRTYSDFVYHTAWYEFRFLPWIKTVWTTTDNSNAGFLRKWERTFLFTIEFTIKALYAQLIEWAAKANYEEPVSEIYALVLANDTIQLTKDIKVIKTQGDKKLISITRWGAFTKSILALSKNDITISEIGGNDEIVVSFLVDKSRNIHFGNTELLYKSKVVTNDNVERYVYLVPVNKLVEFVRYAQQNSIEVEHVYDY